jgi:histidinol-phosphatase (PHP family)
MIVDYHMHLRAPDESLLHTTEAIEPYVEVARARGIDEIGFTEHVYYFRQTQKLWDIPYHVERCTFDLDDYVDALVEAKGRGLPVKLGLEVDFEPERVEETREILAPYPWDYLLGSIHFVDGMALDQKPSLIDEVGEEQAWMRYFEQLRQCARSGLVDVLSHPDLVKFFGRRPPAAQAAAEYASLVDALAGTGVCLEVSSAGLHKPVGEVYPDVELLEAARPAGVPITLASDAHVAGNVGRDLDHAVERARAAGYETVTIFEAREQRQELIG